VVRLRLQPRQAEPAEPLAHGSLMHLDLEPRKVLIQSDILRSTEMMATIKRVHEQPVPVGSRPSGPSGRVQTDEGGGQASIGPQPKVGFMTIR
jgi:hypothetical protein